MLINEYTFDYKANECSCYWKAISMEMQIGKIVYIDKVGKYAQHDVVIYCQKFTKY